MKKVLSAISLLLVAVMLLSVVPASAATVNAWEAPEGIDIYYANDLSDADAPSIDGQITKGEYGPITVSFDEDDGLTFGASYPDCDSTIDDTRADQPASEQIDFYFAYDEDYIYIAVEDLGGVWDKDHPTYKWLEEQLEGTADAGKIGGFAARNNYHFYTGFYLNNIGDQISMQASSRGFDENKMFASGSAMASGGEWNTPDSIVEDAYIKKTLVDSGEVFADAPGGFKNESDTNRANHNTYEGQYKAVIELKYSKDKLVNIINEVYMDEMVELPNAMWFRFTARTYPVKEAAAENGTGGSAYDAPYLGYNNYFVQDARVSNEDLEYNAEDFLDWGLSADSDIMYSLIVFGDEDTEISEGRWKGDPPYYCANGHTRSNVNVVAPTCKTPGYTSFYCLRCEKSYTDDYVDPIGHPVEYLNVTVTAPTCTESGYATFSCPDCIYSYNGNFVDPLGHTPQNSTEIYVEPTCEVHGHCMNTFFCSTCGEEYSSMLDVIPALGHIYDNENDFSCNRCDDNNSSVQTTPENDKETNADVEVTPEDEKKDTTLNKDQIKLEDVTYVIEYQNPDNNGTAVQVPGASLGLDLGGCTGTIGIAGLTLVATLGTCAVFVSKKKED